MSQMPMSYITQGGKQNIIEQMYLLMGKQVKSYHKHRHMGSNSSVPVEIARELMESVEYTVEVSGGVHAHSSIEEAFSLGQMEIKHRMEKGAAMLELVQATAPGWQTECRWEALRYLRHYLNCYDYRHLAHHGPEGLFYPILTALPEGIRGIDMCLFYLKILWIENQVMEAFSEAALDAFWDSLPDTTLNQCEQLLLNGIGKALLGRDIGSPLLTQKEHAELPVLLMGATEQELHEAANRLCCWLALTDEDAECYVHAVTSQILCRLAESVYDWSALFL